MYVCVRKKNIVYIGFGIIGGFSIYPQEVIENIPHGYGRTPIFVQFNVQAYLISWFYF